LARARVAGLANVDVKGLRLGIVRSLHGADARCAEICEEAVKALEAAGATVVEAFTKPQGPIDEMGVLTYEIKRDMAKYLETRKPFSEDSVDVNEGGLKGTSALGDGESGRVCRSLRDLIKFNREHANEVRPVSPLDLPCHLPCISPASPPA
jgi:Asp-tRNA(Asn)/Glu-tRNA(Gln) amidotransferase A subunit family amidase